MLAGVRDTVNDATGSASAQSPGWLFVLPWSLRETGGVNQVVKSLIRCLKDGSEFTPQLLVTSQVAACDDAALDAEEISQFSLNLWSPINGRQPVRALLSFAYRFPYRYTALRRLVARKKIRVINPHYPSLNALLFVALKVFGGFDGQVILSFHGSDVNTLLTTIGWERHLWRLLLRSVDHIVVVSDSLGTDLLKLEPKIAGRVKTIYNGVDPNLFDQTIIQGEESSLTQGRTIISVGAFVSSKGHDVLLQAFSLVAARIPNVRLLLVGRDGPQLQEIIRLIDILSVSERVDIVRNAPHESIFEFLSKADIFVLASRREAFGLVVVEAASARVPVICTRAGGLPELVTHGVTGSLVEVGDHVGLADSIISTLTNPLDAQRMASNFYEHVRANLTWPRAYQKYLQLCETVLDRQSSGLD